VGFGKATFGLVNENHFVTIRDSHPQGVGGSLIGKSCLGERPVTNLDAKLRTEKGSAQCGRLRQAGRIPAVVYGGQGGNVDISLCAKQLSLAVSKGLANFELQGELNEKVTLKAVQYNPFGSRVLHVDLVRV